MCMMKTVIFNIQSRRLRTISQFSLFDLALHSYLRNINGNVQVGGHFPFDVDPLFRHVRI